MRHKVLTLALLAVPLLRGSGRAETPSPSYQVVVNATRAVTSLSRGQLADYFLKRVSRWPDGVPVTAVDLSATSPVRAALSQAVLGRSVDAVLHYWQVQIFSGRGTPPPVRTEQECLALVAATPGAIAYVGTATPLPQGVRPVPIEE